MWGYHEGFGWWMLFGGMWMVLFWGIVIAVIIWGANKLSRPENDHVNRLETLLETAQRRLAEGEVTLDEFKEIKVAIGADQR